MSDALTRLQTWYLDQCDGDWEHQQGIRISTLDNPGWSLKINLRGTALEERQFRTQCFDWEDKHRWCKCEVVDHAFHAYCGAQGLSKAIEVFLGWAETV